MADAKTKELERKTNEWLLKVHKRNEWRASHPKKRRVGWIQPRENYTPLCSGNSSLDWALVVGLYTLLYGTAAGLFAVLLLFAQGTDGPDDHAALWVYFAFAFLAFGAVGNMVRLGHKKRQQDYIAEKQASQNSGALSACNGLKVASVASLGEALHHAQTAYFVSIVVVQWADLVICKTRMNSLYMQGKVNPAMNFGLVFETILAGFLCFLPGLGTGLGTRPIRLLHWVPAVPFSICIFFYDETRKYLMRRDTKVSQNEETGQLFRDPCWLERFTYY